MISNQEMFQKLLRVLFQFDCAGLDFGIYRIMNYKREVVTSIDRPGCFRPEQQWLRRDSHPLDSTHLITAH